MRRRVRVLLRAVVLSLWTAGCYSMAWLLRLLTLGRHRTRQRLHAGLVRIWGDVCCRLLAIRRRVKGAPPRGGFLLVSNHLSYVDILVLAAETGCRFIAKVEIDRWPIFGALCRAVDTLFVDRRLHRRLPAVIEAMQRSIENGCGLVLFAEGTTGPGHRILRFRSPLLELPAGGAQPVHWVALSYRVGPGDPPAYLSVAWWAEMPLLPHLLELLELNEIEARLTFGPEPVVASDRKELSTLLRQRVGEAFEPMVDEAEIDRLERLRRERPDQVPRILRPREDAGSLF